MGGGGDVDGVRAFAHVKALVDLGPRPPGSEALEKARLYLLAELKKAGLEGERDPFEGATPIGPIRFENLLASIPGESPRSILLAGHYDTKLFEEFRFVGANDGGSSAGLLLELARALASRGKPRATIRFAFLDGEEAFREWSGTDSLYGSRHLAARWKKDGTLANVQAMVLLDMVGDRDLQIVGETRSTAWLRALLAQAAADLGHGAKFFKRQLALEDDHVPFLDAGVPAAIDLIDYSYGPPQPGGAGAWWHTAEDTLDKISAESLEVVGDVVLRALPRIEERVLP
ncbi:MAG: M28 family peptidase [Planctomycetes bacterium]|nr:M28 family peptidase [Planctomycetota bacterium]